MGEWKDGMPGGGNGYYITSDGHKVEGMWVEGRIVMTGEDNQPQFTPKDALKPTPWADLSGKDKECLLMIDLCERIATL
jgi:hypothetical protein